MPTGTKVLVAVALVAATGTEAGATTALPPAFGIAAASNLYRGVDYVKLVKAKSPEVTAHVARVAPDAPVDLRVVNANDKVSTSTRELETTSSMCRRVQCVVGVNGDFHKLGAPTGAVISDRRMLHSPDPDRPQLTLTGDGRLTAGPLPWSGSVSAKGARIPVTAVNADPPADGLAVFTPEYGARTESAGRTEVVVSASGGVDGIGLLNQPAGLDLTALRTGPGPIPVDGAVLSAHGRAAQQLRDLWTRRQNAPSGAVELVVSSPVDAVASLGAEPVVLRAGRRAQPWRDPNLIHPRQPHTLVGWNNAGEIYLVAVDGRQPGSEGMTMAEAADFLLDLGVTDAVNLDGGGGTTFVAGGSVWNRPSDNDPARPSEYTERGGTNALVVTSRPGAPLPPPSPPAPKPLPPAAPGPDGRPPAAAPGLPWESSDETPDRGGPGGGPIGPGPAGGKPPAPGELPVGPAAAVRSTSGAAPPGAVRDDPSGAAPAAAPAASGVADPGALQPDASRVRQRTTLAAARGPRGIDADDAAWSITGAALLAAATTASGAGLATVLRGRRRRRFY
jgi:hypothetical protein